MNSGATNARIAIVDDDRGFNSAIVELLESMEFNAIGFHTPDAFLGSDQIESFDCLVSDVQMPHRTGFDLIEALRSRQWMRPILLITARPEQDLDWKAQASGALALLRKPVEAASLLQWLHKALTDGERDEPHDRWRERHDRPDR